MKRMNFTISDMTADKLREASNEMNEAMSRIVENAIWIYLMMQTTNQKQTQLLNQQFKVLREELDDRQMTIDDVLAPLKKKGK